MKQVFGMAALLTASTASAQYIEWSVPDAKIVKKALKPIAAAVLLSLLSGCATNWHNPAYAANPALENRQFTIDNGYCRQVAMGNAPMPNIQVANQSSPGYYITGSSTTYGEYGASSTNYSGRVMPIADPAQSFANGMASGAAIGAMLRAKNAQEEIHDGCMTRLGWMDQAYPSAQPGPVAPRGVGLPEQRDRAQSSQAAPPRSADLPELPEYIRLTEPR